MLKFWATCCDNNHVVFFNEMVEAENIQQAADMCKKAIPTEFQDWLCVTYDNKENYGGEIVANISQDFHKGLQCFPVRLTMGAHNLQWMSNEQMHEVTLQIRTDFKTKAHARMFAEAIGAKISMGAYL